MNQESILEQLETMAGGVLDSIHALQAGEVSALERLHDQVRAMTAETNHLESTFISPVYLGG